MAGKNVSLNELLVELFTIRILITSESILQKRLCFMFRNFIFVALCSFLPHWLGTSTVPICFPPWTKSGCWIVSLWSAVWSMFKLQQQQCRLRKSRGKKGWRKNICFVQSSEKGANVIVQCKQCLPAVKDVVDLWNVHVEPEDTSDIWHHFWVPQGCQHCQV